MTDNLRDRIAAAIYNSSDEYSRKLMVRPECPGASELEGDGKPVCYAWADAVIAALPELTQPVSVEPSSHTNVMDDDYVPPCCQPGGRCNRDD